MIRVLVADDSPTVRQQLISIVRSDARLHLAGVAGDGEEAVRMAIDLRPDVITMDIGMPGVDGIAAIERIMSAQPCPIVVISSRAEDAAANVGFRALHAGALEIVQKPEGLDARSFDGFRRATVETLVLMSEVRVVRRWRSETIAPRAQAVTPSGAEVVGICASTGGPPALELILRSLPRSFSLPVVIVQHIAEGFTSNFVRWLSLTSAIPVEVAADGAPLVGGRAFVAPDDKHLLLQADGTMRLSDALPVEHHRPSGTPLFSSMARSFGPRGIGVILTGMGADGTSGLRDLRASGGHVIAQHPQTCVIASMPNSAIQAGVVDEVIPLDGIAGALSAVTSGAELTSRP